MRFSIISIAVLVTIISSYSVNAGDPGLSSGSTNDPNGSLGKSTKAVGQAAGVVTRPLGRRRVTLRRRNGSLLPDIVLPSISSAPSAPAVARPIPQAVSYPVAQNYYTPQPSYTPPLPVAQSYTPQQPAAQYYPSQQPATQNYGPQQPAVQNYSPQQPAAVQGTPSVPAFTWPTLLQAPKKKEEEDDKDDEEEEDEDEEDEEDYDADDLVTRRRR